MFVRYVLDLVVSVEANARGSSSYQVPCWGLSGALYVSTSTAALE